MNPRRQTPSLAAAARAGRAPLQTRVTRAPLPGKIVGQPAAKRRANRRRRHHGNAGHRENLTPLCRRERVRKDRLRDWHHAAAAEGLQDSEQEQCLEIRDNPHRNPLIGISTNI
jgi:hypothetical protein